MAGGMQSFDVVIAGGGMVGLALACGLKGCGLQVAVLEQHLPETESVRVRDDPFSLRVSAINAASERLLQYLGVWDVIRAVRVSSWEAMEVWDRDSFGRITFFAEEYGFNHLGHLVENDVIHRALWQRATGLAEVTLLTPASLKHVAMGENEAFMTLTDERLLSARLVVGADGADSWLRRHADIPLTFWDYDQHALVATVRTEKPHGGMARQVFHGGGILAFLPLNQAHFSSIVWSLPVQEALRLAQVPDEQFNHQLSIAFDMCLGLCSIESRRQTFPLAARYARSFAAHRLALVGDAAHTVHPLAGQGLNLGFGDVVELITQLQYLQREGKDIGQHLYLRRFERRRKQSAALMLAGMQGFRTLFDGHHPVKIGLRGLGMILADRLPGIKPRIMHQAMGLNDLPLWLR